MDEFAQSRDDDDLFDDDFIPAESEEPVEVLEEVRQQIKDISLTRAPKGPAPDIRQSGSREPGPVRDRPRKAPKKAQNRQHNPLLDSIHAPPSAKREPTSLADPIKESGSDAPNPVVESSEQPISDPTSNTNTQVPAQPIEVTEPAISTKPPAVRGDRTATGGIKKPKLTEEELTAKLAAAKTRSENRSAAHARAEADAANFAEREKSAAEKRRKDAANSHAMEGEREKNRARKMAVMGGREWDAEKQEEDFKTSRGRGRGNYGRNAARPADGIPDDDLSQYQWDDSRGRGRGRGQGRGRGRGGDRGGGRGRSNHNAGSRADPSAEADFPSLPSSNAPRSQAPPSNTINNNWGAEQNTISPTAAIGSWADQVETSETSKQSAGW